MKAALPSLPDVATAPSTAHCPVAAAPPAITGVDPLHRRSRAQKLYHVAAAVPRRRPIYSVAQPVSPVAISSRRCIKSAPRRFLHPRRPSLAAAPIRRLLLLPLLLSETNKERRNMKTTRWSLAE
ncbi:hypothetical protein M0R45_010269 [Rubus argutus]|uniref:Uncharacterized protein n=1 Tax=Rubus argutus TaxID=59490 RepID=A0AAW1Y9W3_RUBAR